MKKIRKSFDIVKIMATLAMVGIIDMIFNRKLWNSEISGWVFIVIMLLLSGYLFFSITKSYISYDNSKISNKDLNLFKLKSFEMPYEDIFNIGYIRKNLRDSIMVGGPDFAIVIVGKDCKHLHYDNMYREGQIILDLSIYDKKSVIDFLDTLSEQRPDFREKILGIVSDISQL